MDLSLVRLEFASDGIWGRFMSGTDLVCYSLEHAYLINGVYRPKVPSGFYTCKRRHSPRFGFELFEVTNVTDCTFIEIHPANKQSELDGCIAPGLGHFNDNSGRLLTASRPAFDQIMHLQAGCSSFNLTVLDFLDSKSL